MRNKSNYVKSPLVILRDTEKILNNILMCTTLDGTKCAPNDSDFQIIREILEDIYEYFELNGIKL